MYFVIFSVVVAAVLAIMLVRKFRAAKARREAPVMAWLESFDSITWKMRDSQAQLAAIRNLGDIPPGFEDWIEVKRARASIANIQRDVEADRINHQSHLASQYAFAHKVGGFIAKTNVLEPRERFRTYEDFVKKLYSYGYNFYSLLSFTESKQVIWPYVARLLSGARDGSRNDFMELYAFVFSQRATYSEYKRYMNGDYRAPKDWDDLIVRYIKSPALGDFRFVATEQAPGAVRLLASRAVLNGSLKDAKIALAFCNDPGWRSEVGDVLTAELGKLVVAKHVQLNLTF